VNADVRNENQPRETLSHVCPPGAMAQSVAYFPVTIGVLQMELTVIDAMSLKDKRRVIKSIKDRIAHAHNVSIAEVGALDEHRRSIMGIAMVSNDSRYVEGALSKLVDFVRAVPQVSLNDYRIELL
jgi:uncharacterized protein